MWLAEGRSYTYVSLCVVDIPRGSQDLPEHHLPTPPGPVVGRDQWHAEGDLPYSPTRPQPHLTHPLPRYLRRAVEMSTSAGSWIYW